jgi:hypothetical protein
MVCATRVAASRGRAASRRAARRGWGAAFGCFVVVL